MHQALPARSLAGKDTSTAANVCSDILMSNRLSSNEHTQLQIAPSRAVADVAQGNEVNVKVKL
jgi:hypothetical protein